MKKTILFLSTLLFACQANAPITQADKDAIQKNVDDFVAASNANSDALGNGYADDIISMPPHGEENSGKQAVVGFHTDPSGPKTVSFTVTSTEIEGSGDLAFTRGTFTFSGMISDSIPINDSGKYLLILKKQADGTWKTIREMWNSNLPMPGQ